MSHAERSDIGTAAESKLAAELARLVLEERQVSARRRKLHARIAIFPSPHHEQAERELSHCRRDLHRRIDALHAERETLRAEIPALLLRDPALDRQR